MSDYDKPWSSRRINNLMIQLDTADSLLAQRVALEFAIGMMKRMDRDALAKMPYGEYLETDFWLDQRDAALQRAENRCQVCNSETRLDVHHRTYERRGDERPEDLIVLCRDCHTLFHENGKLAAS